MNNQYKYDYTLLIITEEKQKLIDQYIYTNFTHIGDRARLSKKVTAYNKNNKSNPLKMWEVVKLFYPSYFKEITQNKHPEGIIENNFNKLFSNLYKLDTASPSRWQKHECLFNPYTFFKHYESKNAFVCKLNSCEYSVIRSPSTGAYHLTNPDLGLVCTQDFNAAMFQEI